MHLDRRPSRTPGRTTTRAVGGGQLAGLADGDEPDAERSRDGAPRMKPRASMPATTSTPSPAPARVNAVDDGAPDRPASARSGVMSLKRMPGVGKSGTSATRRDRAPPLGGARPERATSRHVRLPRSRRASATLGLSGVPAGDRPARAERSRTPRRPATLLVGALARPARRAGPSSCVAVCAAILRAPRSRSAARHSGVARKTEESAPADDTDEQRRARCPSACRPPAGTPPTKRIARDRQQRDDGGVDRPHQGLVDRQVGPLGVGAPRLLQ